jgi:putative Holliday junction resolvase
MRILSADYGEVRTGLAISDALGILASPLTVIRERNMDRLAEAIMQIAAEYEVGEIVVGNPLNMDGTRGEKSAKCERLGKKLSALNRQLSTVMWDERLTTVQAHGIIIGNENAHRGGKSRRRRSATAGSDVDSVAAALILQSYLGYKQNKME